LAAAPQTLPTLAQGAPLLTPAAFTPELFTPEMPDRKIDDPPAAPASPDPGRVAYAPAPAMPSIQGAAPPPTDEAL
jgi:hypothetical protein